MNRENQGFLRKVRSYLCLIIGFCAFSCSVLKTGKSTADQVKNYQVTVVLEPGTDLSVLTGVDVQPFPGHWETGLTGQPEIKSLIFRVRNEAALIALLGQLQAVGVIVNNVKPEN